MTLKNLLSFKIGGAWLRGLLALVLKSWVRFPPWFGGVLMVIFCYYSDAPPWLALNSGPLP